MPRPLGQPTSLSKLSPNVIAEFNKLIRLLFGRVTGRPRQAVLAYAIHVAIFLGFCLLLYWFVPGFLVQNHDGQNLYFLAAKLFVWKSSWAETFSFNPLNGMGSVFWPINPTFIPFLWPFRLSTDPTLRVYLLSVLAATTIFVASIAFFASLRLRPVLAIGAAWIGFALLLLQTVDSMTGTDPLIAIALMYLALAMLVETGRHGEGKNWIWLALFQITFALFVLVHPGWHIVGLPIFCTAAAAFLVWPDHPDERRFKLTALGLAFATHIVCGSYTSIYWAIKDTARVLLAGKFETYVQGPYLAGHLFRSGPTEILWGILLIVALSAGGFANGTANPRLARAAQLLCTTIYAGSIAVAMWFLYSGRPWPGPKPSYVLLFVYPLSALFVAHALHRIYQTCTDRKAGFVQLLKSPRRLAFGLLLIAIYLAWHVGQAWPITNTPAFWVPLGAMLGCIALALLLFAFRLPSVAVILLAPVVIFAMHKNVFIAFPSGPDSRVSGVARMGLQTNLLTDYLTKRAALTPESEFRGYVDDFYRRNPAKRDLNDELIANWFHNWHYYGTGQKIFSWNVFDLPTVSQYSPYIKPLYFAFFSRLLNEPTDKHVVNYLTISRPNARILALMGVRLLVSDIADLNLGPEVKHVFAWDKFHVYELAQANLGQYSPTQVVEIASAQESLDHLARDAFDPMRQVLVAKDEALDPLQKAAHARLTLERGGFRVEARSGGKSLLVLPVQYSHCFDVSIASGDGNARLLRANLTQTGLLFDRQVSVHARLRQVPLGSANCQKQDLDDSMRLLRSKP